MALFNDTLPLVRRTLALLERRGDDEQLHAWHGVQIFSSCGMSSVGSENPLLVVCKTSHHGWKSVLNTIMRGGRCRRARGSRRSSRRLRRSSRARRSRASRTVSHRRRFVVFLGSLRFQASLSFFSVQEITAQAATSKSSLPGQRKNTDLRERERERERDRER